MREIPTPGACVLVHLVYKIIQHEELGTRDDYDPRNDEGGRL